MLHLVELKQVWWQKKEKKNEYLRNKKKQKLISLLYKSEYIKLKKISAWLIVFKDTQR